MSSFGARMPELTAEQRGVVEANRRLVHGVGKRMRLGRRFDNDALQAGTIGLMKAVQRFDPSMGCTLATYAEYWIRTAIQRHLLSDRLIRVPIYLFNSSAERTTRLRAECLAAADRAMRPAASFGGRGDEGRGVPEPIATNGPFDDAPARDAAIATAVDAIPGREREIVRRRMAGETLKDIGRSMGVSKERVRQIEREAHARLRELLADWEDAA